MEFLAGLSTYHVTAVCTRKTTVMALSRTHYERLFVKRNANTVVRMRHLVTEQLLARMSRPYITREIPFFRCIVSQLSNITANNLPEMNNGLGVVRANSDLAGTNWREKSVISTRSFPSTSLKRPSHYAQGNNLEQGIGASLASRPRDTARLRFGRSAEQLPTGCMNSACRNPREGIFVKLMHVSSPEQSACSLHIDPEEYTYLLQLRRRLAKNMDEFYPRAPSSQKPNRADQRLPKLGEHSRELKNSVGNPTALATAAATSKPKLKLCNKLGV